MRKKRLIWLLTGITIISLIAACGGGGGGGGATPEIVVSSLSGNVTGEGGGSASVDVTLSTSPADDVTVLVTSLDTTEVSVSPSVLVFNSTDWNVPQPLSLTGEDDALLDGNQTVGVTLDPMGSADAVYNAVAMVTIEVTNSDDDAPGVTVSKASVATSENGPTSDTFTIGPNTQPAPGNEIVVVVSTGDMGEALVGAGWLSLVFNSTDWAAQTVTVYGVDDDLVDGNQTFDVTFLVDNATTTEDAYDGLAIPSISCTNSDDDTAGLTVSKTSVAVSEGATTEGFTVKPNTQPAAGQEIVLTVTSLDTGEATVNKSSLTFTNTDWQTAQSVTVTGVNDTIDDGNQTFNITIAVDTASTTASEYDAVGSKTVSVTNSDDEVAGLTVSKTSVSVSENATTDSFTVKPNTQPPSGQVIVLRVTISDTGEATVSKTSLTFTNTDWQTAQSVTVTGVNDDLVDGNQTVNITIAVNTANTTASEYKAVGSKTVSVTNSDNDTAGLTVSKASVLVSEGATTDSFTVKPNTQPASGKVIVLTVTSGDTGEATVNKSSLTFTNTDWQTAQSVTVTGVNDDMVDGNQTFNITIAVNTASTTASEYDVVGSKTVSVTNSDNDTAGLTVSKTSVAVTEGATTEGFTVKPNTQPASGQVIVLTVTSGDTGEATVNKSSLTFTNTDWQTAQSVTVTGVSDTVVDGSQTFNVTIAVNTASTTANEYDAVGSKTVSVTNADTTASVRTLPDTGQTTSYTTTYGEDSDYSHNPMSFTDPGTGAITDNVTGLMWQKCSDGLSITQCTGTATARNWYEASGIYDATSNPSTTDVCGSLVLGGYSDWRLPSKKEFKTILHYGTSSPAIDTTYFPLTPSKAFWTIDEYVGDSTGAKGANLKSGILGGGLLKASYSPAYVRCVRGSMAASSFTDNNNGTVTDSTTGLMWQQDDDGNTRFWVNAISYCQGLSLAGKTDWRLPNIKELESVVDDSLANPSVDTTYFPSLNTSVSAYWASTTVAESTANAWYVDFARGDIMYLDFGKDIYRYALCVR